MIRWIPLVASAATLLVAAAPVLADDGGGAGASADGPSAADDAGATVGPAEDGGAAMALACDGGLCDTTNGSQCDVAQSVGGDPQVNPGSIMLIGACAIAVVCRARGRPRRGTYCPWPQPPAR